MESILYNISQVIGITIIHSLWQGLLVWVVLRVAFIVIPSLSAVKRYNMAVFAMLSIFVSFTYTLCTEIQACNWIYLKPPGALALLPHLNLAVNPQHIIEDQSFYNTIGRYLPYISAIYIAGLLANVAKLGWEWNKIKQIKRSLIPAEQMQQFINSFSKKLNITKHIQLKFSELIDVPCMTGYFKPLILLPVSMATYLSACEIESILLHELSHIKRNDYIVNLLQQVITVILFINPFAQLINITINLERENGCDDLVVEKTGKPLIYANALLKLEETRGLHLQLAMSATGKKYQLLNRIERIMKTQKSIAGVRHLLITLLLLTGGLCCIAWFNPKVGYGKNTVKSTKLSIVHNPARTLMPDNGTAFRMKALVADTTKAIALRDSNKLIKVTDTSKHKKAKIKIITEDGKGNKKEYNSVDEMPPSEKEDFLNQNPGFNGFQMDSSLSKFYASPAWKNEMEAMRKQCEEWKKQFNSPEWKKQMEEMQKQGEEMRKQFNSQAWKNQMEAMKQQSKEWTKKFNSPEWKKQMEEMQKQGEEWRKQFNSEAWKNQVEEMQKQAEELKKQFNSQEWKNQMEEFKKQGEEWRKQFNSPEWKKQMEEIQKQGEEWRKNMKSMRWDSNDSTGEKHIKIRKRVEKPEKKEKAEKREKKEKAEKKEKLEKAEKNN